MIHFFSKVKDLNKSLSDNYDLKIYGTSIENVIKIVTLIKNARELSSLTFLL